MIWYVHGQKMALDAGDRIRNLLWALVERVLPRASSALVAILLAYATSPDIVGIYTWLTLGVTLYLSVADGAARQVAVLAWRSSTGLLLIRRYARIAGPAGLIILAIVAVVVGMLTGRWDLIASASPIVLVPLVNVRSVTSTALMQVMGQWRSLALIQSLSAATSLAVSVPILLLTSSLLGPALQLLLTEALFTFLVRRRVRLTGLDRRAADLPEGEQLGGVFAHLSAQAALGWVQGQADRLLLGGFAGTSALGSYSLALAIGRNPGDAISMATANLARSTVVSETSLEGARSTLDRLLIRAIVAAGALAVLLILAVQLILPAFLNTGLWGPSISAAGPILLSMVVTVYAWSVSPILVQFGYGRALTWIKLVGLAFAPAVAVGAVWSLQIAAWLVLSRELTMLLAAVAICPKAAPRRALTLTVTLTVVGSVLLETWALVR